MWALFEYGYNSYIVNPIEKKNGKQKKRKKKNKNKTTTKHIKSKLIIQLEMSEWLAAAATF